MISNSALAPQATKQKIANRGAARLPVLHLRNWFANFLLRTEICIVRELALHAWFLFPCLLRLTVLLRSAMMLHVVRIPAALVVAPRVMRVRGLGSGVRRRLYFLRSQRDQRRCRK
jgi:hypothetical protein